MKKIDDLKKEYMSKHFPELKEAIDITHDILESLTSEVDELVSKFEELQESIDNAENLKDELNM